MNARVANLEQSLAPARNSETAEELTVDDEVVTAKAFGGAVTHCLLSVKGNAVRFTLDATDPASSGAGCILSTGNYYWPIERVKLAKFIESTAGSDGVIRIEPLAMGGGQSQR